MTGSNDEPPRDAEDDDIGYGKPPRRTMFKPGQSGNPKGRPKRALGKHQQLACAMDEPTREMFMAEMQRPVTIDTGAEKITMSAIQMITRAMVKSAANGGQQAQRTAIMLALELERDLAKLRAELVGLARRVKAKWAPELARRRSEGIAEPDLVPHPDDIYIDEEHHRVEIRGPSTVAEKAELDEQLRKRDLWEGDFGWARETYEHVGRTEMGLLNALISQNNYDIINVALPARYQKKLEGRLPSPWWREAFLTLPKRKRKELERLVPEATLVELFGPRPPQLKPS